jgi:hypothetical protein
LIWIPVSRLVKNCEVCTGAEPTGHASLSPAAPTWQA